MSSSGLNTRVCHVLGIEYPILQGGMGGISNAELAAAVSNAGGLGIISPIFGPPEGWLDYEREQIAEAKSLTSKPFGINISIETPLAQERIDIALQEGITVIATAAGSPAKFTKYIKEAGAKVIHVVTAAKHAAKAEDAGVDAVVASGCEGGGLLSRDELTTMVLVPQVVDAVRIPVIAAGGIADARGLMAALALGAEGVQMGTRFLATTECMIHANYKKAILEAGSTDAAIVGRKGFVPARVLKNRMSQEIESLESRGASSEEIFSLMSWERSKMAVVDGNTEDGALMCGAAAGMIGGIVSVGEVVQSLVKGYNEISARL
jgi:enoyl-[acyl-carrier protein] reductase II